MPYDIRKSGQEYEVFNQSTGESKGVSKTRSKAEAHLRALYANEPRKPSTSPHTMAHGGRMALDDSYRPHPILHGYEDGKKVPFGIPTPIQTPPKSKVTDKTSSSNLEKIANAFAPFYPRPADRNAVAAERGAATNAAVDEVVKKMGGSRDAAAQALRNYATRQAGNVKGIPPSDVVPTPVKTPSPKMKAGGKLPLTKIAKTMHKGGLHESLGVPQGEKIPLERIRAAAKRKGKVGKQARLAQTFAAHRPS